MEIGLGLIISASIIYLLLGTIHIALILFTNSFEPRNSELLALNKSTSPIITTQTTLWSGGVGFHLSHSFGLLIFGAFYLAIALESPTLISNSLFFSSALIIAPVVYLFLSIKYWFIIPTIGLALSCIGYMGGLVIVSI
jgi:hypothetical protein